MNLKKLLCSTAAACLTLALTPEDASAAPGYVCEAYFAHYKPHGKHGYVYVTTTTQPGCAGSWVMGAVFCTTGGSGNLCSADDLNSAEEIQGLYQNLQRAAAARQKVDVVTTGNGAGVFVRFYSN
jgi:hypothetical protein